MNTKRRMKMRRGFMCQSPGPTAVCMTGDPRSVIVPQWRTDRPPLSRASLTNTSNIKYTRLVESAQRFGNVSANSAKIRSSKSIPMQPLKRSDQNMGVKDRKTLQNPASPDSSADQRVFQVVVMRVSLHCQGCAGKVKKHISKMEGVTSFSIDLESKRVIVMGHVSPVGVLDSISKVKRAEFWSF